MRILRFALLIINDEETREKFSKETAVYARGEWWTSSVFDYCYIDALLLIHLSSVLDSENLRQSELNGKYKSPQSPLR